MPENRPVIGNYYDKYSTKNPIERPIMKGFKKSLQELLSQTTPKSVLEIGCGEGEIIESTKKMFPQCKYTAVDIDVGMLHQAKEKGADETYQKIDKRFLTVGP